MLSTKDSSYLVFFNAHWWHRSREVSNVTSKANFFSLRKIQQGHSVEISWFFYYSDFTWNQFLGLLKCKICHCNTFRGSEFWSFYEFVKFLKAEKVSKKHNSELKKQKKTAFLERWDSSRLISLKICKTEKSWDFHTAVRVFHHKIGIF